MFNVTVLICVLGLCHHVQDSLAWSSVLLFALFCSFSPVTLSPTGPLVTGGLCSEFIYIPPPVSITVFIYSLECFYDNTPAAKVRWYPTKRRIEKYNPLSEK